MNRILFTPSERDGHQLVLTGKRARHLREVLRAKPGDTLKTGELNGPLSTGQLVSITDDRAVLEIEEGLTPPRPRLDLILALPRPKVLKRLLPQLSALGVDRLFLCNASRVERFYFDCHVLKPEPLRSCLMEGLIQAGDTQLPEVRILKRLRHFMEDDCPGLFAEGRRLLLHPGLGTPLMDTPPSPERTVLAIGPEGGWIPSEIAGFQSLGFCPVQLGDRILRSDTACLVALGIASQFTQVPESAS